MRTQALLLLLAPAAGAQSPPLHTFAGTSAGQRLGHALALLGDLDLDGKPELLIGSPFDPAGSVQVGSASVHSGADGALLMQIGGDASLDHMGWAVASAGDVNGDGRDDLLVGAPESDLALADAGLARVVSGANAQVLFTFTGAQAGERFGAALAGGLDASGDGVPDVLIGAYLAANGGAQAGRYQLRSGASGAPLGGSAGAAGDRLGTSVALLGDLDADGAAELLIGADQAGNGGAGHALLVSGRTGLVLHAFTGDAAGDRFGASVCALDDVDLDGLPDLAIGAPQALVLGLRRGAVRVHSGATGALLARFTGTDALDAFGSALAPAGDLDGDGRGELLIGAPFAGGSGRALVVSPATGAVLRSLAGPQGGARTGWSVAGGVDVDLDGSADMLIGAPYEDAPLTDSGTARLHSGTDCTSTTYCSAQTNSQGCIPAIAARGTLSLAAGSSISVHATGLLPQQAGVFLHSPSAAWIPFQGGILCVQPPVVRSPVLFTGGTPGANCSGALVWAITPAYAATQGWLAGTQIHGQFWSRDPAAAVGTNLTDAILVRVCP